jgi:hypothetical protein
MQTPVFTALDEQGFSKVRDGEERKSMSQLAPAEMICYTSGQVETSSLPIVVILEV